MLNGWLSPILDFPTIEFLISIIRPLSCIATCIFLIHPCTFLMAYNNPLLRTSGLKFCQTSKEQCHLKATPNLGKKIHLGWFWFKLHFVKSVLIWSFSGPYISVFEHTTERYGVSLCSKSECGKMRTKTTPNTDTFYGV